MPHNIRIFPATLAIALCAVLLASCTIANPYTGEEQMSSASKGALIGAGAGAALGALVADSNRVKGALIGAGVGALVGTGIGYYMDTQAAELRRELRGTGVQVTRQGNNITLVMPGNITFATNSYQLNPSFRDVLDSVAKVVNHYEKTVLLVAGYTDSRGSNEYNQLLSMQRAQSVANFLVSQDVNPRRIITRGFGEAYPLATNDTPAGRQQNRRVELTLQPLTRPGT
ncbi:MAG: OmpA family protein [Gammaproteobacteria bacterium]|nr:OmpA family protein [Gammaproteobacteria bacterium]